MANPKLHIPGRHRVEFGGTIAWAWPGVYAEFPFMGPGFILQVEGEGHSVRITVDGRSQDFGPLPAGRQSLVWDFESRAYSAVHVARVQTTGQESDRFFRIHDILPKGPSSLLEREIPVRPLHIEFVGDSWTCGYGNLCPDQLLSDCSKAFAALTAEALGADYSLVAISGHGIIKNYGETPPSRNNLVSKYARSFPAIPAGTNWAGRQANIGVILAGENDFSFEPYPTEAQFIESYRKLIGLMRTRHPGIKIVLVTVDRPHPASRITAEIYRMEAEVAKEIFLLPLQNLDPAYPLGHQFHPGLEHHRQLAEPLTRFISETLLPKELQ
jgi:lysophospholipase L1-like esterase